MPSARRNTSRAAGRPGGAVRKRKVRSRSIGARGTTRSRVHSTSSQGDHGERLQKVLAAAGVGSRRACEELIAAGRVEVDRQVVSELGAKVDPEASEIRLDGVKLRLARKVYYMVNKPAGVVSTNRDPAARMRVVDLVPDSTGRVYTVGRLDKESEGLILVTNDGRLANELTHPRYGVEKTYHVQVAGVPTAAELAKIRRGIHIAEGFVRVANLRVKSRHKKSAVLEIVLAEGRNREIRRMLAHVGHKVMQLKRVAIGGLRLRGVPPGASRKLSRDEVARLRHSVQPAASRTAPAGDSNHRERKPKMAKKPRLSRPRSRRAGNKRRFARR